MGKTLEELDQLAKQHEFSGAHNAITCVVAYRDAYNEYLHKYEEIKNVLVNIKGLLGKEMNELIDTKLKENDIYLSE